MVCKIQWLVHYTRIVSSKIIIVAVKPAFPDKDIQVSPPLFLFMQSLSTHLKLELSDTVMSTLPRMTVNTKSLKLGLRYPRKHAHLHNNLSRIIWRH